ncbi:flagellin [Thetidibacter halocola]|uniref:Flagellar biosynthesis protein FlgL n=1 Tax=Thetidibacter halocola TaxID=2827239 RepID=A0A8J8B654_9RHOB|nr:flagellin [Thetidibacter halocola]MBS0123646.1 flagellar biosynthesis protein FlgL [Thetidibacter halocola]
MDSVGDLARMLVLRTNQVRLREEMDVLAVEVATGFVKDKGAHLRGDVSGLLAIDRSLERLDTFRFANAEAALLTGAMQQALGEIQERAQSTSQTLISAELTPSEALLGTMSRDARDALGQTLGALNRSVGGRFLFSGTATDRSAMPDLETMMTELRTAVTGLTTATDIQAALDAFFAPGGTFETTIYQGSGTGIAPLRLGENERATLDIKATDDALRAILKPLAMASLASEPGLVIPVSEKVKMLSTSGEGLLGAQQDIVELRGGLGALEGRIEENTARIESERTATQLARLDLVGTDQYETATRYENVRSQLESLYAITVRSQRLSLTEFL